MTTPIWFIVVAAPIGACVGSYVATAAVRAERVEQSISGRSRCDGCGIPLGFGQTAPVYSFVRLGGRCQACGGKIDPTHLVGELSGAAVTSLALAIVPLDRALPLAMLGLVLLASALVDAKTRRLPDLLTLVIAIVGLGLSASRSTMALAAGCIAAVLAFAILEGVRRIFAVARGQVGLGFGDVKLIAALALWLGVVTPWAVAIAAVATAAVALARPSADGRIAFGPAIALSAWVAGLVMEAGGWPIWA